MILPEDKVSLSEVVERLDGDKLKASLTDGFRNMKIMFSMPRFKITKETKLKQAMENVSGSQLLSDLGSSFSFYVSSRYSTPDGRVD